MAQAADTFFGLTKFGYDLFLDRYAQKHPDPILHITEGDTVIVAEKKRRDIGKVTFVARPKDAPRTGWANITLSDGTQLEHVSLQHLDLPTELDPAQLLQRIAEGVASIEKTPAKKLFWSQRYAWMLNDWKFVPGGRILTVAGTKHQLTCYNCYVLPSPKDSRHGIIETLDNMTEIMSRGGGVGINVSSLRPNRAPVYGVNGRSSGSVSWAGLYSYATGLIEQAGSRRGALMVMLNDWHPDLLEFIDAKRDGSKLTNCNISIGISDAFMEAVKADRPWQLRFPDTTHPAYNTEWDGDLPGWEAKGYPSVAHALHRAKDIWDRIIDGAWSSAEPGIFFLERYNKMSNSHYYPQGKIIGCNPCAEQGLPAWGVCNLGALNLSKFHDDESGDVDYPLLAETIGVAVRFLDGIIDWTPYFFDENEKQQKNERRVGLGIMGLADLMIRCKIRYGSDEGVAFTAKLAEFIAYHAYLASSKLAQEKGAFPFFDGEGFLASGFMQGMHPVVIEEIKRHGIRNVTLLTVAPTGTTGTMQQTSTGIEPYFAWEYYRASRLGVATETVPLVKGYYDAHPEETTLPDYFVTTMELTPEAHVRTQAAFQRWNDTSISKTVNVPENFTKDQTSELYMAMYDMGCKGGTIYRDNSRSEQVLTLKVDGIELAPILLEAPSQNFSDSLVVKAGVTEHVREALTLGINLGIHAQQNIQGFVVRFQPERG